MFTTAPDPSQVMFTAAPDPPLVMFTTAPDQPQVMFTTTPDSPQVMFTTTPDPSQVMSGYVYHCTWSVADCLPPHLIRLGLCVPPQKAGNKCRHWPVKFFYNKMRIRLFFFPPENVGDYSGSRALYMFAGFWRARLPFFPRMKRRQRFTV